MTIYKLHGCYKDPENFNLHTVEEFYYFKDSALSALREFEGKSVKSLLEVKEMMIDPDTVGDFDLPDYEPERVFQVQIDFKAPTNFQTWKLYEALQNCITELGFEYEDAYVAESWSVYNYFYGSRE